MRLESAFFLLQGRSGYLNGTGEGKEGKRLQSPQSKYKKLIYIYDNYDTNYDKKTEGKLSLKRNLRSLGL